MQHSLECTLTISRAILTKDLREACTMGDIRGVPKRNYLSHDDLLLARTDESLADTWDELTGIVNEYHEGGDQEAEECTCEVYKNT